MVQETGIRGVTQRWLMMDQLQAVLPHIPRTQLVQYETYLDAFTHRHKYAK